MPDSSHPRAATFSHCKNAAITNGRPGQTQLACTKLNRNQLHIFKLVSANASAWPHRWKVNRENLPSGAQLALQARRQRRARIHQAGAGEHVDAICNQRGLNCNGLHRIVCRPRWKQLLPRRVRDAVQSGHKSNAAIEQPSETIKLRCRGLGSLAAATSWSIKPVKRCDLRVQNKPQGHGLLCRPTQLFNERLRHNAEWKKIPLPTEGCVR
mmetsp:Transcript_152178/g.486267  ORF Transcript_152178/g.486267 Transcript_152178/m.486267 type:complete len:211 (-) Transcript_152178:395-1027(-)